MKNEASKTFKATGIVLNTFERLMKSQIHMEGLENISKNPTLFVVNHFTRMETFIIPYMLYKHTGNQVHSLADHSLFQGWLGEYLRNLGATSTKAPLRNRKIISELMKGESDWVIYPEGAMVKNKKVFEKGKLVLNMPDRKGPPYTGAAVLALKVELFKYEYREAVKRGDTETINFLHERFNITSEGELATEDLMITPVNVTYYPLRPGKNVLSSVARFFVKDLPRRVQEELAVEGQLLFSDSDITIFFDKPVSVEKYIAPYKALNKVFIPFVSMQKKHDTFLTLQRHRLTRAFMQKIYTQTAINFDHLFCTALSHLSVLGMGEADFKRAIFLSAREIGKFDNRRIHESLDRDFINFISEETYEPYDNIFALAEDEGVCHREGGHIFTNKRNLSEMFHFHSIRLENSVRVITNELEPLTACVDRIKKNIKLPSHVLGKKIAKAVFEFDKDIFAKDYEAYYEEGVSKPKHIGEPFWLHDEKNNVGVVLSHGYLSAVEEIRPLAEFLHLHGFNVYGVRLRGHGTAPRQLGDVNYKEWVNSYNRGYTVIKNSCDKVVLGGFSSGGLMALINAAKKGKNIEGVFSINAAMQLQDSKNHLVPAVTAWNKFLNVLNVQKGKLEFVENKAENPEINYHQNYLNGINQLRHAIDECRSMLPRIKQKALIIQGDQDPVIDPKSAKFVLESLGSEDKQLKMLPFDRHVIVRREGSDKVYDIILDYLKTFL